MSVFNVGQPREVKSLVRSVSKIDPGVYKNALNLVVKALEGSRVSEKEFRSLYDAKNVNKDLLTQVIAGLFSLLRAIFRIPETNLKPETLHFDLEEIKLPPDVIKGILEVVFSPSQAKVNNLATIQRPRLPTLKQFQWRVDVSISTSSLSRVLEPTIMVKMILSNGSIKSVEVPMKMFHKLRCSVATVLKEIEDLEKRSVLKALE